MSLIGCPSLLFLDEPTTGVDPISRRTLMEFMKNLELSSSFITTHRMDEVEDVCDEVILMMNGQFVLFDKPLKLK